MPLGSVKVGLFKDKLGTGGTINERNISITSSIVSTNDISSYSAFGLGYKNNLTFNVVAPDFANITFPYELSNTDLTFDTGSATGNITLDANGNANLQFIANNWQNYSNTTTVFNLKLIHPNQPNTILKSSANIELYPADGITVNGGNATTMNQHTVHIFDSYETITSNTYAHAKVWDDLEITAINEPDSPINQISVLVVGGGGAGGKTYSNPNVKILTGPGGGGGQAIFYKAPANVYSTGNISITLGNGGRSGDYDGSNVAKGGNTVFGFHHLSNSITAYGGAGGGHYDSINNKANVDTSIGQGGFEPSEFGGGGSGDVNTVYTSAPFSGHRTYGNSYTYSNCFGGIYQSNLSLSGINQIIVDSSNTANITETTSYANTSMGAHRDEFSVNAGQGGPSVPAPFVDGANNSVTPGKLYSEILSGGNLQIVADLNLQLSGESNVSAGWTYMGNMSPRYDTTYSPEPYDNEGAPLNTAGSPNKGLARTGGHKAPLPKQGIYAHDSNTVTFIGVAGGGASAVVLNNADATNAHISALSSGNGGSPYASTGNANTSIYVEPGAKCDSIDVSEIYHGIRGGGGSGGLWTGGFGGHGGEGFIMVYYPSEYMYFKEQ